MNILFIGNSYTFFSNLPDIFALLCRTNGHTVRVDSVTCGGRRLFENLNDSRDALNPNDDYARKIDELITKFKYDALFLQEHSCHPLINCEEFFAGVKGLPSIINAKRTILYATWGRADGSDTLAQFGWTREFMTRELYRRYCEAAAYVEADVSPVGLCFAEIVDKLPEIELYDPDKSHPSYIGTCVAALCHYKTLFGDMPKDFSALKLDDIIAARLAEAVDTTTSRQA